MNTLIIASNNAGKIREISEALKDLPLTIQSLKDYPQIKNIPENGKTFEENALIKARVAHQITGQYVLADDSGLECDDLGGAPGVYSARYAGNGATDEQNNQKLIADIQAAHDPCRFAQYVCVLVLIDPAGKEILIKETCEGLITMTPSGSGGFGYDPYFFLPDKKRTMAELPMEEKNKISHRGKALQKVKRVIEPLSKAN